jgi:hypothetical protein
MGNTCITFNKAQGRELRILSKIQNKWVVRKAYIKIQCKNTTIISATTSIIIKGSRDYGLNTL